MSAILGGMTPATFLKKHWQKKPLLIRQAFPGFRGLTDVDGLFAMANEPGAVGRVVVETPARSAKSAKAARSTWELFEGNEVDPAKLPDERWTLLVQGAEGFVDGGWDLLRAFDFIPAARVDDLMISYAAPGGSVGPHEDLYDVFLLQGPGRRRWQIQSGGERVFDEAAPIKLLTSFKPDEEHELEAGDMLYLPPGVAHWGTAVDACFTYSIGFLAPTHEALVQNWLHYLSQSVQVEGLYSDPNLEPPRDPIEIGDDMVKYVDKLVHNLGGDVEEFVGRLLTGPKPNVVFTPPDRPLSLAKFAARLRSSKGALALKKKTRGLTRADRVFVNGEMLRVNAGALPHMAKLLRERAVALPLAKAVGDDVVAWLHALYAEGFIELA